MNKILKECVEIIKKVSGKDILTLLLTGTYGTKDQVANSDIDLNGIMKDSFDFRKEIEIEKKLKSQVEKKYGIEVNFQATNVGAFYNRKKKGCLVKHVPLSIFYKSIKSSRALYGKKLNFDAFPLKEASLEKRLKFHIKTIRNNADKFKKSDRIGMSWHFKDFIKSAILIADIENQIIINRAKPEKSYLNIKKAFAKDKKHIIHYTMKLRYKKNIAKKEKLKWINMAKDYVKYAEGLI